MGLSSSLLPVTIDSPPGRARGDAQRMCIPGPGSACAPPVRARKPACGAGCTAGVQHERSGYRPRLRRRPWPPL